jgi:hypothetical protein
MSPGSWPCLLLLLFLLLSSQWSLPGSSALGRLGRCVAFLTRTRIDGVATGQGGLRRFAQRHWQGCSVRERPEGSHGTGSCPSSTHKSKILKLGPKTTCHSFRLANCLLFVDSSLPPSSPPSSPPYPPFTTLTHSLTKHQRASPHRVIFRMALARSCKCTTTARGRGRAM